MHILIRALDPGSEMTCGWNLTLLGLWFCLVVYRAAYTSDDEYDNEICPGKLLFTPKRLLLSGSSLTAAVATWRRSSHL